MPVVGFRRFGGPEVLEVIRLPVPTAGRGEVVVEVDAATVNPTDLLMRTGAQVNLMKGLHPPYVPGMEFAGRVHERGEGVGAVAVGQRVMGSVDARRSDGGAQARFVRIPATSVVPVSDGIDAVDAATVPMNGLTANLALEELSLAPGGTILVTGGAGALGGYAIQLARQAGLLVVADALDADRDLLIRLGADHVVPRGADMAAGVRDRFPGGVDGAIDAARIGETVASLVRDGGTLVGVRVTDATGSDRVRRVAVSVVTQVTNTPALARLEQLVRGGSLTPRVARTLPMSEAAEAHRLLERGGVRGRVVLLMSDR
jgi:NADPH:quinone reductase-like Zn-dependent oxidoreductase